MRSDTYRLHVDGRGWVTGYIELEDEYGIMFGSLEEAIPFKRCFDRVQLDVESYIRKNYEGVVTELILGGR